MGAKDRLRKERQTAAQLARCNWPATWQQLRDLVLQMEKRAGRTQLTIYPHLFCVGVGDLECVNFMHHKFQQLRFVFGRLPALE
jgi:hypothetical protein